METFWPIITAPGVVREPRESRRPRRHLFLARARLGRGTRRGTSRRGTLSLTAAYHSRAGLPLPHPPTLPSTRGLSLPLRCVKCRVCPGGGNSIVGVLGSFVEFFDFFFCWFFIFIIFLYIFQFSLVFFFYYYYFFSKMGIALNFYFSL